SRPGGVRSAPQGHAHQPGALVAPGAPGCRTEGVREEEGEMIPAAFEYHSPKTLEDALRLLERHGDEAKVLAGGHSLLPLMKLRLAAPRYVIDLGRLRGMSYIREKNGQIAIGALTTHAELEAPALLRGRRPLL